MASTPELRSQFVARLKQACEDSSAVPPAHQGRQSYISNKLQVAPEAVSKWFKGVSMPRPDKMLELAEILDVDITWLQHGIKPEMDRTERRAYSKQSGGAASLVRGTMELEGINVSDPRKTDPRSAYVDFYATIRGELYPIHVALGREIEDAVYEFLLPKEYEDTKTIGVVVIPGKPHEFIDLLPHLVSANKGRSKGGDVSLQVGRYDNGKYVTDAATWPRIKLFSDIR